MVVGNEDRQRLEQITERVIKSEGRQEGHEQLCAQRYAQILEKIAQLQTDLRLISKIGLILALVFERVTT